MCPLHVLLADDHTLVRAGFRALFETIPDLVVVAEASDGHETLELVKQHRPQLVLMDIAMPSLNGLETAERLKHDFPDVRVVILSSYANEEYVYQALRSGAVGYLLEEHRRRRTAFCPQDHRPRWYLSDTSGIQTGYYGVSTPC